jgi:alpha/beta hydrolase family protein
VPTMHEVSGNITNRQDGDEPGKQYRLYEFSGMGHIDTRDSFRMQPNPCVEPLSTFPVQAYMSVALDHLFKWVDKGTVPPRADRILLDRNQFNDGSMMALDEHGNPRGGVRNPYVDVRDPAGGDHARDPERQCLHRDARTAGRRADVRS